MTDNAFRLLLVEDSDDDARFIERTLAATPLPDCDFTRQTSYSAGLSSLATQAWDVLVIDLVLPDGPDPQEIFKSFQAAAPLVPIIAMSGLIDENVAKSIINQGAHAFLAKDRLDRFALHSMIQSALETKRLQGQLLQRNHEMRQLIQNFGDGIVVIDMEKRVRFSNPAAQKLLGTSNTPIIGTTLEIPLTPGIHSELEFVRAEGTNSILDINLVPVRWEEEDCFLASLRDISERKRLEAERIDLERTILAHQRVESLCLFAGGIAHDFNNFLACIIGHAEVLTLELDGDSAASKSVELIKTASRRAATLCEQLQAYEGKGTFHPRSTDLNRLVTGNEQLLRTSIAGNINLSIGLDQSISHVLADASQITQVLMNLVINARDAIATNEGQISITSRPVNSRDIDFRRAIIKPEQINDTYVCLQVEDNGCGMPESTVSRMLEPFYSTKADSRGLGLSTVQGIIQGHRGILTVQSKVNHGTTLSIYLTEAEEAPSVVEDKSVPFDSSWRYHGHILVVDDEPHVREVAARMLKHFGCSVTAASSGTEALAHLGNPEMRFDIVLLDLSMPIQSGPSTLRAIRQNHPSTNVILMSGFEEAHSTQQIGDAKIDGLLRKPFGIEALGSKLRSLLSDRENVSV